MHIYSSEVKKLTPWAIIVARAAPPAPIDKTPTKTRSPTMFRIDVRATKYTGVFESPRPLYIELVPL